MPTAVVDTLHCCVVLRVSVAAGATALPAEEQWCCGEAADASQPSHTYGDAGGRPAARGATGGMRGVRGATGTAPATPDNSGAAVVAALPSAWPSRSDCVYTACWCEENVWWLAQQLVAQLPAWRLAIIFISNSHKMVSRHLRTQSHACVHPINREEALTRCRCLCGTKEPALEKLCAGTIMCCWWHSRRAERRSFLIWTPRCRSPAPWPITGDTRCWGQRTCRSTTAGAPVLQSRTPSLLGRHTIPSCPCAAASLG